MYQNDNEKPKFSLFKNAEKHFWVHKKCECKIELIKFENKEDYT